MPMILPEELASKSVIPAIRALIVKRLVEEHGMTQQEAAKLLGVTQPAVSNTCTRNAAPPYSLRA